MGKDLTEVRSLVLKRKISKMFPEFPRSNFNKL
jgi:hypothetical protein